MIALLLSRWRLGLSVFAALAMLGLALAGVHYRGAYRAEAALRASERREYVAAQAEALRIAQEAVRATEARYAAIARKADHEYTQSLADARSAADRYIAANRVRGQTAGGAACQTPASAEDHGAGFSGPVPNLVVMDEADVRRASEWQEYGSACHNVMMEMAQ